MANVLLNIDMITLESIRLFMNTNAFLMGIPRQYDDRFAIDGAKIGDHLRIRLPSDFTVATGPALSVQDTTQLSTTLTLATQKHVDVSFSTADRTMKLDNYSNLVLAPMVNNLAAAVAADIMSGAEGGISNFVANQDGSGAILAPIQSTYLNARATLANNSALLQNLKVVNSPNTEARVVASLAGLLNPAPELSRQYRTGRMYDAMGFVWMMDQTVLAHTTGTLAQGSATVNGANQTGLSLTVNALAGSLALGDVITIAGVNMVNRLTKQSVGQLEQFVVTAAAAVGATTISLYPAITPPVGGQAVQFQTVTASPANGAAVNPASGLAASTTYRKNFAYAPEAVTMATADLVMPTRGVVEAARHQYDGLSMRMLSAYVPGTDQIVTRLDILYGSLWIRPEWSVMVADNP